MKKKKKKKKISVKMMLIWNYKRLFSGLKNMSQL